MEVEGAPEQPSKFVDTEKSQVLFFKLYDPSQQRFNFIGKLECNLTDRIHELTPRLNALLSRDLDLPLLFFEEISTQMVEPLEPGLTLDQAELGVGDIITIQIPPSLEYVEPNSGPRRPPFDPRQTAFTGFLFVCSTGTILSLPSRWLAIITSTWLGECK